MSCCVLVQVWCSCRVLAFLYLCVRIATARDKISGGGAGQAKRILDFLLPGTTSRRKHPHLQRSFDSQPCVLQQEG